jgi:PAS domain S-box-containing protein
MNRTVLMVEDDVVIAMAQQADLESYGYKVLTVISGEKAIEAVKRDSESIHLVLMDIDLGSGMDGTETAQRILKEIDIPVVFLSSHTNPELVEKTEKITSYGYVVKDSGITVLDASIKMAFKLFSEKQKVEASEFQFHQLFSSMKEGVAIYKAIDNGKDFEFVDINESGLQTGYKTREETIGHKVSAVFPEVASSGLLDVFTSVYQTGKPEHFPLIEYDNNNIIARWIENYVYILPTGLLVSVYEDVTERRKAQDALIDSETQLHQLFNSMREGVGIYQAIDGGKDFEFVNLNDAGLTMENKSRNQVIGCRVTELFPKLEEAGLVNVFREVYKTGKSQHYSVTLTNSGQAKQWMENYVYKLPSGLVISVFYDTTEQHKGREALVESEDKYRNLVENINEIVFIIDMEGKFSYVNKASEVIAGFSPEEILGKPFVDYVHPEDFKILAQNYQDVIGGNIKSSEYRIRKNTGDYIWVRSRSTPIYKKGGIIGLRGIMQDITQRKRTDQSNEALQKANKEKEDLLIELQHRAKNSFSMVYGLVELMARGSQSESVKSALSEISSKILAVSEMYDLLYTTKAVSVVNLDEYLQKVLEGLPVNWRKISLTSKLDPIRVSVKTAIPIGLIVSEIITNAVKYAFPEDRFGSINISLRKTDSGSVLTIEDDGIGIPKEFILGETKTSGLGLVSALTTQIEGKISMQVENGTRFALEIPIDNDNLR